jgi:parallel beta-helix repeat protein
VTIKNLTIEKYASSLQGGTVDAEFGENWRIEDNTIRLNHGVGVNAGPGSKILRNRINKNGHAGYAGGGANFIFESNEIADNNYAGVDYYWEGGGGKVTETAGGGVIRRNCVHDNDGPGIWMDVDANKVLVENNVVFKNTMNGILHEISYDGIIRNNIVADNGERDFRDHDWLGGSQIYIQSSRGVRVYGNTVDVPAAYGNAITIVSEDRPPHTPAINNEVYGNTVTIRGTNGGRLGAVAADDADNSAVASNNSMRNNTYHLTSLSKKYWSWNDHDFLDWNGIRAEDQEAGSTADTNLPAKPALNCDFLNLSAPIPPPSLP